MYRSFIKRIIDVLFSVVTFCILFIPFIIISILLLMANKGTPFFYQKRPGKNEKIFTIIKFKTMNDKRDVDGELLRDTDRLTLIGRFIRKYSLDEIPQLLNVIKGDMSLIGPRPLLPEYLPFYTEYHKRRHEVKPGITGLAQVTGRNNMKFSERFNMDVQYVDNLSFALDCKILWLTVKRTFKASDLVLGQTVDEVDDLGIARNLPINHFKKTN